MRLLLCIPLGGFHSGRLQDRRRAIQVGDQRVATAASEQRGTSDGQGDPPNLLGECGAFVPQSTMARESIPMVRAAHDEGVFREPRRFEGIEHQPYGSVELQDLAVTTRQ